MTGSSSLVSDLERAVVRIESGSSVEVVVSVANQSGSYKDVDLLWGWVGALISLAIILWSPWSFSPNYVLGNVVIGGFISWLLSRHVSPLRRLFTTRSRRQAQVEQAARLDFLKSGVDATSARTGILVYLSRFERRLVLVADRGATRQIPAAQFQRWQTEYGTSPDLNSLLLALRKLLDAMAEPLAHFLPRGAHDTDELDNRPRLESV